MTAQSAHAWALDRWRTLLNQAGKATPGPWHVGGLYNPLPGCRCLSCYEDKPWGYTILEIDGPESGDCIHPVHVAKADAAFIAALGPDRVIVLCEQAIDRLTAHAPYEHPYYRRTACPVCVVATHAGSGRRAAPFPCSEVRAWTAWWAGQDDYPAELK